MRQKKLFAAHQQTDLVVISNQKTVQHARIVVGVCIIKSKSEVRHLAVMLDARLNFKDRADYVCRKA